MEAPPPAGLLGGFRNGLVAVRVHILRRRPRLDSPKTADVAAACLQDMLCGHGLLRRRNLRDVAFAGFGHCKI